LVLQAFEGTLRQGMDYALEYRIVWPAGTVRWIEGRGRLFRDTGGAPARMIAVCIDITDRKQAETAFLESEQRFGGFMQHLPGLAWIKDVAGRYVYANDAAVRAFDVSRQDLYGKTDEEIFPPERAAEFRHNDRLALQSPAGYQAVETLLQYDGILHYSVVNKFHVPAPDGRSGVIGGIAIDITEHKRAEAELQKQNVRLMLLGEAASVLLASDTAGEMLGRLFRVISAHLGLDTYANYLLNDAADGLQLASCGGFSEAEADQFRTLKLGESISGTVALERRPIEASHVQESDLPRDQKAKRSGIRAYVCHPLLTEGRLIGTLAFGSRSRDRFPADDLAFLRTISRYVTVASERLGLIEQLRDADRRKDEFLATLAHELRNPLAPIRNALHIQRLAEGNRPAVEQARAVMERQLEHLVRLIDDLLDVSRITRGKLELRIERVELTVAVQSAVEANRSLIQTNQHQLIISLPSEPLHLEADLTRLSQIFQNLLHNAVKYTPPGGKIWLTATRETGEVIVRIRDTGVGIPAGMLGHVFEMFAQLDGSLERSQEGGLGIGLTLVKRLVEMHGGSVEARSEGVGLGSEFVVRLPVARRHTVEMAPQNGTSLRAPVPRRILVADDNRESAESLGLMLELMGNEVHIAHDGLETIALAEQVRPDVAVIDIGMPKLNGYDAARRMRSHSWGGDILLIALTGWGQQSDKLRSAEAGFDHHLVKPVDPAELERLLALEPRGGHPAERV
ncbi:MAG TPA: ATP-binding protein, partial [Gemmatimonadales bacterium]